MKNFKKGKFKNKRKVLKPKARVEKNKNLKFIQRGKISQDLHKKQKQLEDKYREEAQSNSFQYEDVEELMNGSSSEEENLLETLAQPLVKDDAEDSEEDISDDDEPTIEDACRITENPVAKEKPKHNPCKTNLKLFLVSNEDSFATHLDNELTSEEVETLLAPTTETKRHSANWPTLGTLSIDFRKCTEMANDEKTARLEATENFYKATRKEDLHVSNGEELSLLGVKKSICQNTPMPLSSLQTELLTIMNNYQDLYYAERNFENSENLRLVYCLHALNHMLKTRSRIIHHNAKLTETEGNKKSKVKNGIIPDSYRDQGLTRPKVLFVLPYRDAAYKVINMLVQLFQGENAESSKKNGSIINYARFDSEYTGNELYFPKTNPKPEDYEKIFQGNTDDNFRIGLSLTKKCLKLYTDFYASDILIASPLGLRTIIGAQGSKDRDYDFLNSIELLIIDQAELIMAQNWENLLHVLEHMHLPPQSLRDTDFQRVRQWYLNGFSRFYRQTLFFASHELPEFRAVFNNKCFNYEGKVRVCNPIVHGDIRNVVVSIPQVFQRFDVSNFDAVYDERFKYFIHEVLPKFRSPSFAHCMVYIPSYFDYVRLRNYFKEETINCVQICEYTKKEKIARARDIFFHSGAHFILYSERSHFFKRTRVKGIRHLIMYQLPQFPHFYSEMINLMHDSNQNRKDGLEASMSITMLISKYDYLQLSAILGTEKATALLKSSKTVHAFTAE